jgi:hypothetical protein
MKQRLIEQLTRQVMFFLTVSGTKTEASQLESLAIHNDQLRASLQYSPEKPVPQLEFNVQPVDGISQFSFKPNKDVTYYSIGSSFSVVVLGAEPSVKDAKTAIQASRGFPARAQTLMTQGCDEVDCGFHLFSIDRQSLEILRDFSFC